MLQARLVFSSEELLKGFTLHQRQMMPWLRWFYVIFPTFLILFSIYAWIQDEFLEACLFFLFGVVILSGPFLTRVFFKRQMAKHPFVNREMTFLFDEQGLQNKSVDDMFDAKQSWAMVYEAVLAEQGFLLYPQKNLFYWVPKTAFTTGNEFEETRLLITKHVAKCKTV
jgi:uncharacterized protein YneF (UPF0154 family)